MGNCLSSGGAPARREPSEPAVQAQAQAGGVADRQLYPVVHAPSGGLSIAVSSARCAATAGASDAVLVRQAGDRVFVALFEGLGPQGRAVAAFCRSAAWEAWQECAVRHPGAPLEALRATLERLDAALFATDRLKHAAKATSGASAVLLLLELGSGRCYCANVGAAACLLSRISGSFNAKTPEGFFLSQEHTTRNRDELVHLQKRAPGEATPPRTAAVGGGAAGGGSDGAGDEPGAAAAGVEATRALGFMEAKRQAGGSGALVCEAYAADHALTPTDQHLVLATAGFWRLVGPTDCALRAHFHEKFAKRELDRAAAEAAAAGAQEAAPSPSLLRAANTAEHLVYWALEKAARRLARLQQQRQRQQEAAAAAEGGDDGGSIVAAAARPSKLPASVADLLALPLVRPPPPAAAAEAQAGEGGGAAPPLEAVAEAAAAPAPLIRSDVLGDLGVVVVTLRRQGQSMDGGMRQILLAARARADAAAAAAAGRGAGAAPGAGPGGGYVERLARRRWDQVRMLVDFYKAHRRVLLRQWWDAQDALFRRGRTAGASAGRIQLRGASASGGGGGGLTPSPSKLPALAAAAAAARRARLGAGAEDQGAAANRSAAAAGSPAAKGSPLRSGGKPSPVAAAKGSPARGAAKPGSLDATPTGSPVVKRPGSRIGSGSIKAVRPGSGGSN